MGTRIISQSINLRSPDISKYITKINSSGITIHPEVWTNQASSIQLDGTGMILSDSSGTPIAQFGSTTRIGKAQKQRVEITSTDLILYNSNNSAVATINTSGINIASGTITLGSNFSVTSTGVLTSKSGTIGGWTIDENNLKSTSGTVGLKGSGSTSTDVVFWAGNATSTSAPFRVTRAGALTATSATLGGTNGISITSSGVTLGSNCSISWGSVTGTGNIATTSDIPSDAHITQITNNAISTASISANQITTGKINSVSGRVYFDLDNDELVCSKLIAPPYENLESEVVIDLSTGDIPDSTRKWSRANIRNIYGDNQGLYIMPAKPNNAGSWFNYAPVGVTRLYTLSGIGLHLDSGGDNYGYGISSLSLSSNRRIQLFALKSGTSGTNIGVDIDAPNEKVFLSGNTNTLNLVNTYDLKTKNLTTTGSKNRLVTTNNYSNRLLYCYETPSPMFGDLGDGLLDEDGLCIVEIDDIFSETVRTDMKYQIFLQKQGPGDIWVSEQQKQYFIVQGTPNLKFSWEIKAKQTGYESERLEDHDADYMPDINKTYIDNDLNYIYDNDLSTLLNQQEAALYETA